jgi:hypothetical protein
MQRLCPSITELLRTTAVTYLLHPIILLFYNIGYVPFYHWVFTLSFPRSFVDC